MKHLLFILLVTIGFRQQALAQQKGATASDLSMVRFVVKFNPSNVNPKPGDATTYLVEGDVEDPIFRDQGSFTGANVQANYFFVDGGGEIYLITASNNQDPLTIEIKRLDGLAFTQDPAFGSGVIYQPTPNLLLPQWVTSMSSAVQGALLSHMANMIDRKLSTVASPSVLIKTAPYTVVSADDTILFNLAAAATVTLPAANTANGKTYKIGKVDESTNILTFSPAIKLSPTVNITTLNYARTFVVQSNGTDWWVVNQY
ncbi:MAG: hypothetical protein ACK4R6_04660 [Spirosomataceae bacterium]